MHDMMLRVWENLIGRLDGPMHLRVLLQPTVATILAVRAGMSDARRNRPVFLWAVLTNKSQRRELLRQGWQDIGKVFAIALVLDLIYQLIVHRTVYPLELLISATLLAIVPYVLVRGPASRIARPFMRRSDRGKSSGAARGR
jgi:hypothetical protein